jgi:primosomal protein N' (replication factor Y) (superfamily II helicase)
MQKFIIKVAPLIPLPALRTQVFSYWHEEDLPAGTLVSAPFYFREVKGIVIGAKKGDDFPKAIKLKSLRNVIEKQMLGVNQIELAQKIAAYYFAPLGSVLKLMVPSKIKNKKEEIKRAKSLPKKIKITNKLALEIISGKERKYLMQISARQTEATNMDLIRHYLQNDQQSLFLVPEVFSAESLFGRLQKEFSEKIVLIHGRVTKSQYFEHWQNIQSGKIKIIVATKLGIFLPFKNLGMIIVQDEQDPSFKQWESMPRYNGVRGAELLAEISGAKLVLESALPSVENFFRAERGEMKLMDLDKNKIARPKIEIANFEKWKNNPDFPISSELYSRLAEVITNKKQAVVFMNRRGFSTRTICENCKKILKCPKCNRALIFSDEDGQYHCLHCSYKADLFTACSSCGGFQFSHRGIGTQTVEKKIKKLFPSARTVRLDADDLGSIVKVKSVLKKFSDGEIDILVGTQSVVKGIYSKNISLVASISGRDFADGMEFDSRHLALARLFQMEILLSSKGTLVLQSFSKTSEIFDYFEKNDAKKYYRREITIRKRYNFPPFGRFIKLVYRDKLQKKAKSETKKTFDLLRATGNNEIELCGPYAPVSEKKRGYFQQNILIKADGKKEIRDLPIRPVLGGLRKGWSVDVDPVVLF